MPSNACWPSFRIPIPDLCARGIVADIFELYVKQDIKYFFNGTLRLNPFRFSTRCKKTKEHYIKKLQTSGSKNCWGLPTDFKAMWCAFYNGVESYQAGTDPSDSCATEQCCTASRANARKTLAKYLSGEVKGPESQGIFQRMMPKDALGFG